MKHKTGWSPDEANDNQLDGEGDLSAKHDEISTVELLIQAISEGKAYALTEIERQGLRAKLLFTAGRDAAIFLAVALFLLSGIIVALLIGCIWTLAPYLGAIGATAVVTGCALLITLLLVIAARTRIRRAINLAFGQEENHE